MPATLVTPVVFGSQSATGVHLRNVRVYVESDLVDFDAVYIAGSTPFMPCAAPTMTHAAFKTALLAAGGTFKNANYVVLMAQLGLAYSAIT